LAPSTRHGYVITGFLYKETFLAENADDLERQNAAYEPTKDKNPVNDNHRR